MADMLKWVVKVLVRHPERHLPSWRDWESRTAKAVFDCSKAKKILGWQPTADREIMTALGIQGPAREAFA
jgi:nucleoside-diphosphate-sugar epimerase